MNHVRADCRVSLRRCLAIIVRKEGCLGDPGDFWMYDNGYLLFQGLLTANSICWWNSALNGATKSLVYRGYVTPGAILVGAEPCALEILRGAWSRRVLQPPAGYQIVSIEDIEDCQLQPVPQTQWTPLPEAVCAVVLRLSSQGRPAAIPSIREALIMAFPHVNPPSERALYDTLVQLTGEKKLYHSSRGYFIVTPERRRSRSHSRGRRRNEIGSAKTMLMSTEEALVLVHGEMTTIRDGDITHQCIQTNLADVICGGNSSDKVLIARNYKRRSASFPSPKSPDRRSGGAFRLWGSTRRLRRSASTRTLAARSALYAESSSSTEYNGGGSSDSNQTPKKASLLSRLFRRSKRSQCQISSFSAQFPPTEWFNSKATHLHNVGTQTSTAEETSEISLPYYFLNSEVGSSKSATLPRRHRRQLSDSIFVPSYIESRDHSPNLRYPVTNSSLPRSPAHNSIAIGSPLQSVKSSRKTSRSSLAAKLSCSPSTNTAEDLEIEEDNKSLENKPIVALKTSTGRITKGSYKASSFESLRKIDYTEDGLKTLASLDNSGPSSIESQKSSKTGSSITSGPSSLESHKTVISRHPIMQDLKRKAPRSPKRRDKEAPLTPTPLKAKPDLVQKSPISHSNSFTLQVTTNQNGTSYSNTVQNATTTATINNGTGGNTKIYVQNSPVRSVITFENGQVSTEPNVMIVNGAESVEQRSFVTCSAEAADLKAKNTNSVQNKEVASAMNNSNSMANIELESKNEQMNNIRKLSLQAPARDLSYRNLLKNVSVAADNQNQIPGSPLSNSFREFTKNSFEGTPPSPTKSFDGVTGSTGIIYSKNLTDSKTSIDKTYNSILEKNILGSEPNISFKETDARKSLAHAEQHQFPSLSDLSFNFTSLAAQKILKGVSINSIDTLVELNMAATPPEKQNNCDVVHTDFGLV